MTLLNENDDAVYRYDFWPWNLTPYDLFTIDLMTLMHLMMFSKLKNLVVQSNRQNQFIVTVNARYQMVVPVLSVPKVNKVVKVHLVDQVLVVTMVTLENKVLEVKWDQLEKKDLMVHQALMDQRVNQVITDVRVFMDLADEKGHAGIQESRFAIDQLFRTF